MGHPVYNVKYCRKLKIPNFVRPNLWESLTSQYSHNSSALIAQPRENLSDKMLNFHPLCSLLDQTRSQHLYRIPGEYLLCSNLKLPVSKLRSLGGVNQTKVGFIYTFWSSLLSTSSILEQGFQSIHHLQMNSSEGFHQHFSIISYFVCCGFYIKKKVAFKLISFAVLK